MAQPRVYDLTENGAKVKATISTNGGLEVTEKGVCYSSTNSKPTLEDTKAISTEADNNILVNLGDLQVVSPTTSAHLLLTPKAQV